VLVQNIFGYTWQHLAAWLTVESGWQPCSLRRSSSFPKTLWNIGGRGKGSYYVLLLLIMARCSVFWGKKVIVASFDDYPLQLEPSSHTLRIFVCHFPLMPLKSPRNKLHSTEGNFCPWLTLPRCLILACFLLSHT